MQTQGDVVLVYLGTTPLPGTDAWAALPEDEQKQIYADYGKLNKTPGVTRACRSGLPDNATTGSAGDRVEVSGSVGGLSGQELGTVLLAARADGGDEALERCWRFGVKPIPAAAHRINIFEYEGGRVSTLETPFRLPEAPVATDLVAKYFRGLGDPTRLRPRLRAKPLAEGANGLRDVRSHSPKSVAGETGKPAPSGGRTSGRSGTRSPHEQGPAPALASGRVLRRY